MKDRSIPRQPQQRAAALNGAKVITIEGLGTPENPHLIQGGLRVVRGHPVARLNMSVPIRPKANEPDRYFRNIAGQEIRSDGDGFMWSPDQWTGEMAKILARESGLPALKPVRWKVLRFMRGYYLEYGRAPLNREIKQSTGIRLIEMEILFPRGIKYGARRLAGLPNPRSCL